MDSFQLTWNGTKPRFHVFFNFRKKNLQDPGVVKNITTVLAIGDLRFIDSDLELLPHTTYSYRVISVVDDIHTPTDWTMVTTLAARAFTAGR